MPLQPLHYLAPTERRPGLEREYIVALGAAAIFHGAAAAWLCTNHLVVSGSEDLICFSLCIYVAVICGSIIVVRLIGSTAKRRYTKFASVLLLPAIPLGTALGIHGLINIDRGTRGPAGA